MGTAATVNRSTSRRGIALVVGLFVFGVAMMALLFRAPRTTDRAPDVPMAAPRRTLRIVSVSVRGRAQDGAAIGQQLKRIDADVYLLQGVRVGDVPAIGRELGMSRAAGDVFYPAQNLAGPSAGFGNAIFSRFPMYESRSIPSRGGSFGVWAVMVVDDAQFLVASMDPTDSEAAEGRGAVAAVERGKELAMLAQAFAATQQATLIAGAHVPGWETTDEVRLRSGEVRVQMVADDRAVERILAMSRIVDGKVSIMPIALPADAMNDAVGASVGPSVSGG